MNAVFVDSFYFFAILNPNDGAHDKALAYSKQHSAPLVTTTWVLTELADGLARTTHRALLSRIVSAFRAVSENNIVDANNELFEDGIDLYHNRLDKQWSLTDCVSFVVMEQQGIQDALTGDHHFEQAGFTALLK